MIYEYECQICKDRATAVRKMSERDQAPMCCAQPMERGIFTAPRFQTVEWNVDYFCPALGQAITSKKQREDIMQRRGLAYADDFGAPDVGSMEKKSREVKESAEKPMDIPPDLRDAMVREGHDDLL